MLLPLANVLGGVLLAEPMIGKIGSLKEPVEKFNAVLKPFRNVIGVGEIVLGGGVLLYGLGILGIPFLYYGYYGGVGIFSGLYSILMGGLLAQDILAKFIPRGPLWELLHKNEQYIGIGGIVLGALTLF